MKSGIYSITFGNGKQYIGSALRLPDRKAVHLSLLRKGKHHSIHLQNAFNKYGEAAFRFKILLMCKPMNLLLYEQLALDSLKPEYNILKVAGSRLGAKFDESTKARWSAIRKGVVQTPEHIAKRVSKIKGQKRSEVAIASYVKMRERKIMCVETREIFPSGKSAGDWCKAQGLTSSNSSGQQICRAIREHSSVFGYHWIEPCF